MVDYAPFCGIFNKLRRGNKGGMAKAAGIRGKIGYRLLPKLYTSIADIYRFGFRQKGFATVPAF